MKKLPIIMVVGFLFLSLIFLSGCESKEEKQARIQKEQEIIEQKAELELALQNLTQGCTDYDSYDNTFCAAEKAMGLFYERVNYHPEVNVEKKCIEAACNSAEEKDICYYYAAVSLEEPSYCFYVEDRYGCRLLASNALCNAMDNKIDCLHNRAFFLSYMYPEKAAELCYSLKGKQRMNPLDIGCGDIEFNESYYERPARDRFLSAYWLLKLAEFEVEYTRE